MEERLFKGEYDRYACNCFWPQMLSNMPIWAIHCLFVHVGLLNDLKITRPTKKLMLKESEKSEEGRHFYCLGSISKKSLPQTSTVVMFAQRSSLLFVSYKIQYKILLSGDVMCRQKNADQAVDVDRAVSVVRAQEKKLLDFCLPSDDVVLPPKPTLSVHVQHAKEFRRSMKKACSVALCAVCSMSRSKQHVAAVNYKRIPNLSLLEAPSDALTKTTIQGKEYILQPTAVDASRVRVNICDFCLRSLERGKVPIESLASFDAGPIPRSVTGVELQPLTMVEENLVARYQVCR
jgi:hypothetical protein